MYTNITPQGYLEIYPKARVKPDPFVHPAVIVKMSNQKKSVNLFHRRMNHKSNKWESVQFNLNKKELQDYINTLQELCNVLEK